MPPARSNPAPARKASPAGFALVVTLVLMVLLSILALGLLSLSGIALRQTATDSHAATARANARLALMMALGQLQTNVGPDQCVTARADLTGDDLENPHWTGIWDTRENDPKPLWLVSGENPDPAISLPESDSIILAPRPDPSGKDLRAASMSVENGAIAWWVGDEGVKARIDLDAPATTPADEPARLLSSQSAPEPGLTSAGPEWKDTVFGPDSSLPKSKLISLPSAALAADVAEIPSKYFHDLTSGGYGLPVNVRDGGMKADLSLLFDRSQLGKKAMTARYLGGSPKTFTDALGTRQLRGAKVYDFEVTDRALANLGADYGALPAAPHWGILYNYAHLWENLGSDGKAKMVGVVPRIHTELRYENFFPYGATGGLTTDKHNLNSPVAPVLSSVRISFRLRSKEVTVTIAGKPEKRYEAELEIKPTLVFWNPYNVAIAPRIHRMQWSLNPYLRFDYQQPPFVQNSPNLTRVFLREYWVQKSSGGIPTDQDPSGNNYMVLDTEPVDFQPGEFRVFSITENVPLRTVNILKPGFNEKGAIVVTLKQTQGPDAGKPVRVPADYQAWFNDVFLQDTHHPDTLARFPTLKADSATTWLTTYESETLGQTQPTGGLMFLSRRTNFWNGGNRGDQLHNEGDPSAAKPFVPERIVSTFSGGSTSKPTYRMEDLSKRDASGNPTTLAHIGTWEFSLRGTVNLQGSGSKQALRNWIDANPRALVSSNRFDGLNASGASLKGWNFNSAYTGGSHSPGGNPPPYGTIGDGAGGNRGLVAEAGIGNQEPEMAMAGGRFQGFGGPSNTAFEGHTHVINYDVPRTPLVSLAQFQHAQLSRYNYEPGYAFANSYANPRISLNKTTETNAFGISGLNLVDISHQSNEKIWDSFFFSTLGIDYRDTSASPTASFDSAFGNFPPELPNPRMTFHPLGGETSIDSLISDAGDRAPEAIAARTRVEGAFNINSTSIPAWSAILSSMEATELPVISSDGASVSWEKPGGIRFSRFTPTGTSDPYETGDPSSGDAFWKGWRELSRDEIRELATEIVVEVKARGPFLSLADFINRDPGGSEEQQRKGSLQAAIDRVANKKLESSGVGNPVPMYPPGSYTPPDPDANQAAGQAGYLLQGDLLQRLGPVLTARSDTFRIRAYGEAHDPSGKITARAWCEATVQRTPAYVDPTDPAHFSEAAGDPLLTVNQTFGRRFEITSFRWLNPVEL